MGRARDRPFLTAGEAPRRFSEVLEERAFQSADYRRASSAIEEVERLERLARDPQIGAEEREQLQCEAEALRAALTDEQPFKRRP